MQLNCRMKCWLCLLLMHSFPLRAAHLWLRLGEVRSLPAAPTATIRVGQRGIVRVVEGGPTIQLVALKPGVTTVSVDRQAYLVTVSLAQGQNFFRELGQEFRHFKGLRLSTDSQPLVVYGTLLRMADWTRLATLATQHQGQYEFRAQALPDVAAEALAHFTRLAREKGFPILRFSASPQFTVHVPAAHKGLKEAVAEVFGPYGVRVVASASTLAIQPLIRTKVILAELSRSQSQALGVEWPSAYQARVLPKVAAQDELAVTLKALEARGQAQVLAAPNLLCRSGGEAKFHAGGEFPIRMVSRTTRDVIWKSHGVVLNVRPKADFQGAMSIEIETEVSLLDMANAVDGLPALKTNRVKSHFDLPGRRTIALSGLLRQETGDSREGLPYLSRLPVLGSLFSSRQFQAHQSELVIFVTPEIHTPEAEGMIEMPKGWVRHEW